MVLGPIYGGTGSGSFLTTEQNDLFKHFKFNPVTDQLEADRPIGSTLNSFLLGEQHSITSGARNIFFKNLSTNINFYPPWGGIKDQSIVANQDATGLIPVAERVYGDNLLTSEVNGAADVSGTVLFRAVLTNIQSTATYSVEVIVEEAIVATDFIFVDVWNGTDGTGIQLFSQILTGLTASVGGSLKIDATHSMDLLQGDVSYIEVGKASSREGVQTLLTVRRGLTDLTVPYFKFGFRTFINEPLANKKYVHQMLLGQALGDLFKAEVEFHADLPLPSTETGNIFRVLKRTANYFTLGVTSRFLAGYYESDGTDWILRPNAAMPTYDVIQGDDFTTPNYRNFTPADMVDIFNDSAHGLNRNPDSFALGNGALGSTTTALRNVAIGASAGAALTSGKDNVFLGQNAGNKASTAQFNFGLGTDSLLLLTTGNNNVGIGEDSLRTIKTTNKNVAIGGSALRNTIGTGSVAIGFQSMDGNTTGAGNTGVGWRSLFSNTIGIDNTGIGLDALQLATASGNTAIGARAMGLGIVSGADNVAVGWDTLTNLTSGSRNVAIGALAMDAATVAKSNIAIGHSTLGTNIIGDFNVAIGDNALLLATGNDNVGIGFEALTSLTTGIDNTAIGTDALRLAIASGNTAIGARAMSLGIGTSTGIDNTAIGRDALSKATGATDNVSIGRDSMLNSTVAKSNVAIGGAAMQANISGDFNVAIGHEALFASLNDDNVGIGFRALFNLSTGIDNIAIGDGAGSSVLAGNRNILIGENTTLATDLSDRLNIGNSFYGDLANNKFGIGVSSPNSALDIAGPIPGTIGGFTAGQLMINSTGILANDMAAISGHNAFNGNTQLWFLGSTATTDQAVSFINRQTSGSLVLGGTGAEVTGIDSVNDVDDVLETVTATAHPFANGDKVKYSNGGGTSIGGLIDGNTSFIVGATTNTFQLALTVGGAAIDLTDGVGTAHSFTIGASTAMLSPNGLESLTVDDLGAFYNGVEVATVDDIAAGSGDVTGPAVSIDFRVPTFNGTTGKLLRESPVTISSTGIMLGVTSFTVDNLIMNDNSISAIGANQSLQLISVGTEPLILTTGGTDRLTILSDGKTGIGTTTPGSLLEMVGALPGTVGGFSAGQLMIRSEGTLANDSASISGHNSFVGNSQLWFLGSSSSSNQDITFTNRRVNGSLLLNTATGTKLTISGGDGKITHNDFTVLGAGNVGIKIKEVVGTSPSAEGGTITIAHGLPLSKIVGIQVLVNADNGNKIPPEFTGVAEFQYHVFLTPTSVSISNHITNSFNMRSNPVSVLITYL